MSVVRAAGAMPDPLLNPPARSSSDTSAPGRGSCVHQCLVVDFALATWLLAVVLVYSASPRQRWLRVPLPAFPTRVSAVLAAIVGMQAWGEALRFLS